ncbi:MAG: putative selenate reductase molybdopterin-binding subunit [Myxococcota bacterium]|jgi:putative selenate reductase molybdopterin-binding subunit
MSVQPDPKAKGGKYNEVGRSVPKVDGLALACGQPVYVADKPQPGLLHARVLRSRYAHARILSIDKSKAEALPGVHAVLTWEDLPRIVHTTAGQGFPEPSPYDSFVLDNKVRYVGDRVAAVAAETPEIAAEALRYIDVKYEQLEAVFDAEAALEPGAPIIHDEPEAHMPIPVPYDPSRNLVAQVRFDVEDVDAALDAAEIVVEGRFTTSYAQHVPLEPHVCQTWLDEHARLMILTSTQVPFHVRRIVAQALDFPLRKIRVIKPRVGGGFGAKQEVLLEQLCSALTLHTGRPVLLELSRAEEWTSSRTRHAQALTLRSGANKDGSLAGIELKTVMNTGAFGSHGLTVVCNTGSKTLPLYRWPAMRFDARTAYTNLPVGGAYRGYGATQGAFAMEVQMDELAEACGIDPVEFRLRHIIKNGETSPVFEALGEGKPGVKQVITSTELARCLELGAERIDWANKRGQSGDGPIKRGVGMCALMQGSAIPHIDMAAASIKMNEDGSFNLHVGATDLGTGSDTVLAQIAAEVLQLPTDWIIVLSSDTDITPFDVGAYASSTTYLSGQAVRDAAMDALQQVLERASMISGIPVASLRAENGAVHGPSGQEISFGEVCVHALYEDEQRQIAAHASKIAHTSPPPFAAHFAEVTVDTELGDVRVVSYVAAVDCGQAINPKLAEGQCEGAILNGISYALVEEYLFNERGRMWNQDFNHYKLYTTRDFPGIDVQLVESHEPTGPFGAKSVSEININGPMPAIANAIYDAVGVRLRNAPFTAEKVLNAIREKARG